MVTPVVGDDEARFRTLLDERGILRPSALSEFSPPPRSAAYAVFSQEPTPRLDLSALSARAAAFFQAKLGLTVEKRYEAPLPVIDAARVVVWSQAEARCGTRLCVGRQVDAEDLSLVEAAELRQGTYGMAALARRCHAVWLIACEATPPEHDPVALSLAAIFASVMLGPIVAPCGTRVFGIRTARQILDSLTASGLP